VNINADINESLKDDIKLSLEGLNRENFRLNLMLEMAKLFGVQTEFEDLLKVIIDQICKLLDAERATIFIVDHKNRELWSRVGSEIKLSEIRFSMDKGLASKVAKTKKTIRKDNVYQDPDFNDNIDKTTGFKTRNLIAVPMINSEGKVIGVFQVINKKNDTPFTLNDEVLLSGIAGLAAIRLENIMLIEKLKLSERLSILGKLTSGISHEIKNMLTPLSLVELIPQLEPHDLRIQKYCNIVLQCRNQIVDLLNEIREVVVGEQKFEVQPICLSTILTDVVTIMKFDPNIKNCRLITKFEENIPSVCGNAGKIKQVLVNLIRNSAQAMAKKSGEIVIKLFQKNDQILITVSDNGIGIPTKNLNRIWEPFFSTKKDVGTGLGLDICKKIIEAHGAQIDCVSKEGEGSTFTIYFNLIQN
jgi:signal transduction histidine kinase